MAAGTIKVIVFPGGFNLSLWTAIDRQFFRSYGIEIEPHYTHVREIFWRNREKPRQYQEAPLWIKCRGWNASLRGRLVGRRNVEKDILFARFGAKH